MKINYLVLIVFLLQQGCISSPPSYAPQNYLSKGEVLIKPQLNKDFTTKLHKFIELDFYNDSNEWVRISDFKIEIDKNSQARILTSQEQIEEWAFLRSSEIVTNSSRNQAALSSFFSLFGLGVALVEIGNRSDNITSSSLLLAAEEFDYQARENSYLMAQKLDRALNNYQASKDFDLPPGRGSRRWFIINTPQTFVPKKIRVSYIAHGTISKYKKPYNIEFNTM